MKGMFRIGLFVIVMRRVKRWTWIRPKPTVLSRLVVVASHWTFLTCVFEFMLFRREKIKRWFPKIVKFVEKIDPDLMKDQIEPCVVSHPGEDCSTHARRLFLAWWMRILPVTVVGKSIVYVLRTLIVSRKIKSILPNGRDLMQSILDTTRLLLFIFGSSGLPGAAFCLTKKLNIPTRRGTRAGMVLCSLVGSMSVFVLNIEDAARMVHSTWVSAVVFAVLNPFIK